MDFIQIVSAFLSSQAGKATLGGAVGGAVRSATMSEMSRGDILANIFVGAACAYYLQPWVVPILKPALGEAALASSALPGTAGFMIGLTGLIIPRLIIDAVAYQRAKIAKTKGGENA